MKKIFYLVLLVKSFAFYSQNKIINISYEIYYNTEVPNTQLANLFVNESSGKSIYKKRKENSVKKENVKKSDGNNVEFKFSSKIAGLNFFDIKKDSLYSVENIFGQDYLIGEKITKINWELSFEEKTIDSIKVSKAIGEFRGRKYIAWYSTEYPIRVGPWKLQGLPGLIFEAYDENRRYNWTLKKITEENYEDSIFKIEKKELKSISINEYPNIKYNKNTLNESIKSKLPRGTTITETDTPRNGLEIKFEWEK